MAEPESPEYPDPQLAMSLYCAGRLDRVIHEVVAPFRRELRAVDPERRYHLWMLRYARGGEHLKVRVHGPPEHGPFLRERLEAAAQKFFDGLQDSAEPVSRRQGAPPVDEADLEGGIHPDRTLVWTRHRRSPIVLGDLLLLGNDAYVARHTACLSAGCEAILDVFEPDDRGGFPFRQRQLILSRLLAAGLRAVFPALAERRAFLAYHRDWVARSLLLGAGAGLEKAASVLERFRAEAERMGPGGLAPLAKLVNSFDAPGREADPWEAAWGESLTALRSFLDSLVEDPAYDLDPFAAGPVFPACFKVFHGIANPLGITPMNEALTHHLLLRATGEDDFVDRFVLVPA
ncbi:MAG TPA: lantibiotic dehydratase C-terminal domain-containing protein [Thermoanaerobaculia bacterium]|nr:lantibiotic dehydratase C-terminal domain-containing protein [Thermoanaerobaculia bacterium]